MSLNDTVKQALGEAVERRRKDPKFKACLRASSEAAVATSACG
jgi:hypothetical protein